MDHLNDWVLLSIAALNVVTAFIAYKTHQSSRSNANAIQQLETNTNSIREQLVESTAKASFAAGETKAREIGEKRAIDLLKENNK